MIMQYKDFIFPHNPRKIEVETGILTSSLLCPFAGTMVQRLGQSPRAVTGEGQFFGPRALYDYRRLEALLQLPEAGYLAIPGLPAMQAYFVRLALSCEGDGQMIHYRFGFLESMNTQMTEGGDRYGRFNVYS